MRPGALTQAARSAASAAPAQRSSRHSGSQREPAQPGTPVARSGSAARVTAAVHCVPGLQCVPALRVSGLDASPRSSAPARPEARPGLAGLHGGIRPGFVAAAVEAGTGVTRAVAATASATVSAAATAAAIAPRVATAARAVTAPRPVVAPRRAAAPRAAATPRGGAIAWPLPPLTRRHRDPNPAGSLPHRLGAFVVSLPDHPWLDRLVRGRAWIPVLGILLAGIVATQVEILKLGASMGRAIEQTTTLTSENEQLRGSVAMLGDDQRIERLASAMGMVLPPPGAVGYLPLGPNADVSRALNNLHSPDPSAFVSLTPLVGDGALVTGQGTSTLPPTDGAVAPTVSTPSVTSDATASNATSTTGATQSSTTASDLSLDPRRPPRRQ